MELKTLSMSELFGTPCFDDMCAEYASESGNADLGYAIPNKDFYLTLERLGKCFCVGAFNEADLVGFGVLIIQEHTHYSKVVGWCDSIWISKAHRRGYAGVKIIRKMQDIAKEKGAVGVYFSAPDGSRLSMLFERLFQPKDHVYWAK